MFEVTRPDRDGAFPEIRDALTHKATWIWIVGYIAVLIVAIRWPFLWEFSVLCCFPAPFFCYGVIRSRAIHSPGIMKIAVAVAAIHCVLLAGTLYLWKNFPKSITGDYGFGFVLVEVAVIELLMRFARPRPSVQHPSQSA